MKLILFPCKADKSPDVSGTWKNFNQSYYNTALARLSSGKGLVGVVIQDGFWLLDIDSYKDECSSLEEIDRALGCSLEWGAALIQTTKNRGSHYLFRLPEGFDGATLPNSTNILGLAHVDSRSSGRGYVCTGQGYRAHGVFGAIQTGSLLEGSPVLPYAAIEVLLGTNQDRNEIIGTTSGEAETDEFELEDALSAISDDKFNEYSNWINLLLASHKASCGAKWGLLAFDRVSREKGMATDCYESLEEIEYRWNNAGRSGAADAAGFATIMMQAKEGDKGAFERIVGERKQATVINSFDVEPVELEEGDEADEGVSASGHVYSECFKKLSRRREFTLKMNSHVCEAQSRDDFTYINISESGAAEKIRDLALRAAAERMEDFELYACEDDVFEMINEFNALYDGDVVFGILPEFLRKIFLRSDKGSSKTGIFHQRLDARWEIVSEEVFNSNTRQHYSFSAFTYGVKRFNPSATKTWRPTPFWVARDFYGVPMLTGETYEMFAPKVISCDGLDMNKKLNLFEPYRALTLCRNVKTGATLPRDDGRLGIMAQPEVAEAWHVFQEFIFSLVGADIRRIGYPELDADDSGMGVYGGQLGLGVTGVAAEREGWARLLIASMASTVQRPDARRNWALLLKGAQGVGKSTISRVLKGVLDDSVMTIDTRGVNSWHGYTGMKGGLKGGGSNVYDADLNAVLNRFNIALKAKLVCVIEELAMDEKIDTAERMKEILTSEYIRLEGKGVDVVVEKSYLNFYIFSNKRMPLMLGAERRFAVMETAVSDEAGSDAVLEYMAAVPFTHVDGRAFISGRWGDGCVPEFRRELWLENESDAELDFGDGENVLSQDGVTAYGEYFKNIFDYKDKYFEKLNSELVENEDGLKALGAALALLDVKAYCPEFSLTNAFSSSSKNQMISLSTGNTSIGANESYRINGRVDGAGAPGGVELAQFVWGEKTARDMVTTRAIMKETEAGSLLTKGSLLEIPDEQSEIMRIAIENGMSRRDSLMEEVVRKLVNCKEPLINLYVVNVNELSAVVPKLNLDRTSDNNHRAALGHCLAALGYTPYLPVFKANGGDGRRGIDVSRRINGKMVHRWVMPSGLYVFGARISGVEYHFSKNDNTIVRRLFSAAHR